MRNNCTMKAIYCISRRYNNKKKRAESTYERTKIYQHENFKKSFKLPKLPFDV